MKTVYDLFTMGCLSLLLTQGVWAQQDYSAGYAAGASITTGTKNTFIGFRTGQKTTTGSENTFVGRGAGLNNKEGSGNIFLGVDAGYHNIEGFENIFIGKEAGMSSKNSSSNVFIGHYAGRSNIEGFGITCIGESAGFKNLSGNYNTFVGFEAGWENTEGYENTMIGTAAGWANTTGFSNTFLGLFAGFNNNEGSENTFVGRNAGISNSKGNRNTAIGYEAGPKSNGKEIENATAVGYRAVVTASDALVLGSIKGINGAEANTNVGIGVTAPKYQLHLSTNSAAKPGSSVWKVASDKRLKQDIVEFTDGLSVINQIKPVKYRYNGKAGLPQDKEYVGVVAQEIQEEAPYMIDTFIYQDSSGNEEEYLDFDATALTYILVNAIKEQQQKITELESKLTALKQGGKSNSSSSSVTLGSSNSRLEQNIPNPYTQSTEIRYQVPEDARSAFIKVYGIAGEEIETFDISGQSEGKVILSSDAIPMGTYIYQLWVDGQLKDSKKLIQTR